MAYSDSYGDTPLMLAAESQTSTELVKVLLDAGAETNPTDEQVCIVANNYARIANQLYNLVLLHKGWILSRLSIKLIIIIIVLIFV